MRDPIDPTPFAMRLLVACLWVAPWFAASAGDGSRPGKRAAATQTAGARLDLAAIEQLGFGAAAMLRCGSMRIDEVNALQSTVRGGNVAEPQFDRPYQAGFAEGLRWYDAAPATERGDVCRQASAHAVRWRPLIGKTFVNPGLWKDMGSSAAHLLECKSMRPEEIDIWRSKLRTLAANPAEFDAQYQQGLASAPARFRSASSTTRRAICAEMDGLAKRTRANPDGGIE